MMRQWRILIYFDSLMDFSLGCLSRVHSKEGHDCTPIGFFKLPKSFFMQVTVFQQTFTFEVPCPLSSETDQARGSFSEAIKILKESNADSLKLNSDELLSIIR